MKKTSTFFTALFFSAICGGLFATVAGLPAMLGAITTGIAYLIPSRAEGLRSGIYTEVWTGEMIKAFRTSVESIGWLNRISV